MLVTFRAKARKLIHAIAWKAFYLLVHKRYYGILTWLYARVTEERLSDGTLRRPAGPSRDDRITILALAPQQFRGDLHFFAASGEVRVLQLPEQWKTRLMYQFYPQGLRQAQILWQHINARPDEPRAAARHRYRLFLRGFLPRLYRKLGVNCVVGHHVHHPANVDWGAVSDELGFPYIVLHRESLLASPHMREWVKARVAELGRFEGSHIVVHNRVARETFIDAGFVEPERISSLGCVRMDSFLKRIAGAEPRLSGRKKVTFFALGLGGVLADQLFPFFRDVHVTLARLAMRHPELDVVMKSKPKYFPQWCQMLQKAFDEAGISADRIPNLHICCDLDAQTLILDSNVVCGLNSTTLLEAGIAGKPVVLPYFGALRDPQYDARLQFREGFHLFDVATTPEAFEALVLERLDNPGVDRAAMEGRGTLFEKYVSNLDGNATEKYLGLVRQIVA
ncbi:MAG: hypothetical protein ACE5KF_00910 [Kiloniellaceae bacterium]